MKTKLLISAFAVAAMLMGGTSSATAQGIRHRDMGGSKQHMERKFDNRRPGPIHIDKRHIDSRHFKSKLIASHRPAMGARFVKRPGVGRFITHKGERLLLANGVLYREVRTPNGFVYIVVGYI